MNTLEILNVAREMRERKVNGKSSSPTLVAWAERLEKAAYTHPAGAVQVPDGYVLVPREPTQEMRSAGERARLSSPTNMNPWHVWNAMLAAAPKANHAPPTSGECRHDFRKGTVANCIHCGECGYADPSTPLATPAQAGAVGTARHARTHWDIRGNGAGDFEEYIVRFEGHPRLPNGTKLRVTHEA